MPDEAPTCQECGVELEGRDVYESMCRSCREDMVLGGKSPTRRREDTVSQSAEPPPALPASVTMEEDTKEMDAVQTPASTAAPTPERVEPRPVVPQEPPAGAVSSDEEQPSPAPPALEGGRDSADAPSLPAPEAAPSVAPADLSSEAEDLVPAIVAPSEEEPASAPSDLASAQADLEEVVLEPDTDAIDSDDEVVLDLEVLSDTDEAQQEAAKVPPRLPSEPLPALPAARELRLESDDAASPASAEASPAQEAEPQPPEAATGAEESPAAPAPLDFADSGAAAQMGAHEDFPTEHIRRALDRLGKEVDALAAELERVRGGGRAPAQQIALGFRLCVGFVLGLGLLGVLVVGGMYVVGKFLHPPTLELLERALRAITE